jgi:hypothetical protein
MSMKKFLGVTLATAAAISFVTAPLTSTTAFALGKKVHCYGVNSCKGKGSCKTADSSCKGKNSCKGKGVVEMSKKKCAKKGGTETPPEQKK